MLTFRKCTASDSKELTKLFNETVFSDFPEYNLETRKFFRSKKYREEMFSLKTKFGAFLDGKLIGYLLAWGPHGGVAYIYWFAINKDFRDRGVGSKFLTWFEAWCKKQGVHNIQLQADDRNIKYYEDRGYEVWGDDKLSYFGTDTHMMRKIIQKPKPENYLRILA